MLDFFLIGSRMTKSTYEIYPRFLVKKTKDLMIRGGRFYAVWDESRGLWSTNEYDLINMIDQELDLYFEQNKNSLPPNTRVLHMWDAESGVIDKWNRYSQTQMRDNFVQLDDHVTFLDTPTKRDDYASKRLSYPLVDCDISSWNTIVSTLYDEEERRKIEWAIGAIFTGAAATDIQKFIVFYGGPGTGKSTIMNIIQLLFDGYYNIFNAKDLTSSTNVFSLESFRDNPLVSIEHDAKLDRIEDNTKLNSLVSHEWMTVNEKYKSNYQSKFRTFLFMGTNKPVKITDSKSGLLRRLIDVHPSGRLVPHRQYNTLMNRVPYELGGIAMHCIKVFNENPDLFDDYIPIRMMDASNDFYNFMCENFNQFESRDGISLKDAWDMYKAYCQEANVTFPFPKRIFKEEMRTYFKNYFERNPDGRHQKDWFSGLLVEKFPELCELKKTHKEETSGASWVSTDTIVVQTSLLDTQCAECYAQYATEDGVPKKAWDNVRTKLSSIDTSKMHYVLLPENHIVVDCDLLDKDGNKDLELNIKYAQSLPPTYCEASKGGGLHLHYLYSGDVSKLDKMLTEGVEIKTFGGKKAIRRRLTRCNNLPIATISSGLPMKGEKRVVNTNTVMTERKLRTLVVKNMNKEIHSDTRSSIDFIKALLDEAYNGGLTYDIRDMRNDVINFAARSTNQANYCMEACLNMKFCSDNRNFDGEFEDAEPNYEDSPIVFFDCEVFPNVFILCHKILGDGNHVIRLINPEPSVVRAFIQSKARKVGFNNRRYDNHILYAWAYLGYDNRALYKLSANIVGNADNKKMFAEAYNISYTDIFDFASAGNKKSLKKLEIEMKIHHKEFEWPWDKPLPEDKWEDCADYCANDVIATEAAFNYLAADYKARLILADIAGMTPNSSTNQLSCRIIFGVNKTPQNEFNYRNLAEPVRPGDPILNNMGDRTYRLFDENGQPTYRDWAGGDIPEGWSVLPFFPGYTYEFGKSVFLGTQVGEGGYVYAEPNMYRHIALLDVASMHPSSLLAECLFGPKYSAIFAGIVNLRIDIKHGNIEAAKHMFDGKLEKWLDGENIDGLADALKTVINSVYGLSSAGFVNQCRDPRNVDNIVAKRGALFMRRLQSEVQKRGFTVAHIKTDSIKIPGATDELIDFVMNYGREFGYNFEYEANYDCMTLVNDAVYIARYDNGGIRNKGGKKAGEWTATGKQFAVPYVFKTLFTHEELSTEDLFEVFTVKTAIYADANERCEDVSRHEKELKKLDRDKPENAELIEELKALIAKGHNYNHVGKVGCFFPIQPGNGGSKLYREGVNKYGEKTYSALPGSSGYRWMEYETVKTLGLENKIDMSYFESLAADAKSAIEQYGDFDWFVTHELDDHHSEILPF